MKAKKWITMLLAALLLVSLTACKAQEGKKQGDGMSKDRQSKEMTGKEVEDQESKTGMEMTLEEAVARFSELKDQEGAILSENTQLWDKVYLAMDKNSALTLIEDGKNYGDYLLETMETIKDQFTEEEWKLLQGEAEKIRQIESELTLLEEKYPEAAQMAMDKAMDQSQSMSPGQSQSSDSMSVSADGGNMQQFPAFAGKDLEGNEVTSQELFSQNAVTVVNLWFTTCGPCVGELGELEALNQELMKKGGSLIGINAFTLDGNETDITEAREMLQQKGATYQNVYFDSDSQAGELVENTYAYPTTYVVDRQGNLLGEPIVGAITNQSQREALDSLIDKALAADRG